MIRVNIPGLFDSDVSKNDTRRGDCTIISTDYGEGYTMVIDGYNGAPARRMVKRLKEQNPKNIYLYITHPHYDHRYGIGILLDDAFATSKNIKLLGCPDPASYNKNFSASCKSDVEALERIIRNAKSKGIPVVYLKDGQNHAIADIKFTVYRDQPKTAENTDSYLNDGSLCFWFPELGYLTTGDAGLWCAERHKLPVKSFKGGHHDNDNSGDTMKPSQMCRWLKQRGCEFFWDNDYSTTLTDFLMTGREDALNAGMRFINIHGDINFVSCSGKVTIYKGGQHWTYACDYKGKNTLKSPSLAMIEKVLSGEYGSSDARVTNLLDKGYSPVGVQNHINKLYKLIKG